MHIRDSLPGVGLMMRHPWRVAWAILFVLVTALLVNHAQGDTYLWRSCRWLFGDQPGFVWTKYAANHPQDSTPSEFFNRMPPPFENGHHRGTERGLYQRVEASLMVLKSFGENLTFLIVILVVILFERRHIKAGIIFAVSTLSADAASFLIRMITGRYRPDAPPLLDGANRWSLFRGFWDGQNLSFPSGHATAAFAIAGVLTYLSPPSIRVRAGILFVLIASGTAVSRVIMLAHFPSDVMVGAAIGLTVSWHVAGFVDRRIPDPLVRITLVPVAV